MSDEKLVLIRTKNDVGRARYRCPVDNCTFMAAHTQEVKLHGIDKHELEFLAPREAAAAGQPLRPRSHAVVQEGETVVIGHAPERVVVTVENGKAKRRIETYVAPMADVFDAVCVALRDHRKR